MKIIIDIPEDTYRRYKLLDDNRITDRPIHYIAHGKPLQKGHGRLIDESRINEVYVEECGGGSLNGIEIPPRFLIVGTDAPTIIEADKEMEE